MKKARFKGPRRKRRPAIRSYGIFWAMPPGRTNAPLHECQAVQAYLNRGTGAGTARAVAREKDRSRPWP